MVQSCVVTLDPVTTRIDQPVRRTFLPETAARGPEIVVDPEEDDEIEPLTDRIDLGRVAVEALALALPAYPRKPGATFAGRRDPARRRTRASPSPSRRWRRCAGSWATNREAARRAGRRPAPIGPCASARNRYGPRLVFLSGPAAKGVTSRAASATSRADEWVFRAAARQISRLKHGCSEKQGHARQARHAPVA